MITKLKERETHIELHKEINDIILNKINKEPASFIEATKQVDEIIKEEEMVFNGEKLPFSLKPLIITSKERKYFQEVSESISSSLEKILSAYKNDNEIKRFFSYYKEFENLINLDPGYIKKIRIARLDTVWYGGENFKILEPNTCCPGGVVVLGRLKERYMELPFIREIFMNYNTKSFLCDSQASFIEEMVSAYREGGGEQKRPNIAFANYNGNYTYELTHMQKFAFDMGIDSVVCDLRNLKIKGEKLYYKDFPIDIIYNKVDQLQLGKGDIDDVLEAVRRNYVYSINSYISMFIGESKMTLALLTDEKFQAKYLTEKEIEIINKHVPWTRKLEDNVTLYNDKEISIMEFSSKNKDNLVLKIDNETRGSNIFIGKNMAQDIWDSLIQASKNKNYIIQEYCPIPKISVPKVNNKTIEYVNRMFGIDMFIFGGKFAGVVSRISEKDIINVGQGGFEQPVVEVDEGDGKK